MATADEHDKSTAMEINCKDLLGLTGRQMV
jgi:hypothetical protein